jgi:hypothetical protein
VTRHAPPSPEALGRPIAYLALDDGTPVFDGDGKRIGVVEHVMEYGGIFEGVIVHTYPLPGRHLYASADQLAEIREHGVLLSVGRDELRDPDPRRRDEGERPAVEARLRRAWDWISGRG